MQQQQQPCHSPAARAAAAAARFSLSVLFRSVCRERLNATGLWKSCVQGYAKQQKRKKKKRVPNCKQAPEIEMCKK